MNYGTQSGMELDKWQVEMYNIDAELVTTLNKDNPTSVAETPFSVRLEYEENCKEGIYGSSLELDPPLIPTELGVIYTTENTDDQPTFECELFLGENSFASTRKLPNETILVYINDTLSESLETEIDGSVHFDEHIGNNKYEFRYMGDSNHYPCSYIRDLS